MLDMENFGDYLVFKVIVGFVVIVGVLVLFFEILNYFGEDVGGDVVVVNVGFVLYKEIDWMWGLIDNIFIVWEI